MLYKFGRHVSLGAVRVLSAANNITSVLLHLPAMSFVQKFVKFCNENVVLIAGVGIIISTHWGWSKLQNTALVPEEKRKELPAVIVAKYLGAKVMGNADELKEALPSGKEKPQGLVNKV